ncbi:MAG TPA: ABC transporter substrate-binding protein [Chloroflexota bacterium]|jgi:NitT/TauT family transport system substrate-binding protein
MSRSSSSWAGALLAGALLLAGCGQGSRGAAPAPAEPPRAAAPAPSAPAAQAPASQAPAAPAAPAAAPSEPVHVRYASQFASSDVPLFIAVDKGYFREAGIDFEFVRFGNSSEAIPALGTGQVDASSSGTNPALWNAVARGIPLKMVLDKGTFRPGWGDQALAIRKAVFDSGRGHSLDDLQGLRIAMTPPGRGTASGCALAAGLQRVGQTLDLVDVQPINFPEQLAALANGAVDGSMLNEPFLARALSQGTVVRAVDLDQMYPNFTISTLIFSGSLYDDKPTARGFAKAFIRAVRDYLGARAGSGSMTWTDVADTMGRYTGLDPASLTDLSPAGFNPNGLPNKDSLLHCYQFFRGENLIPTPVPDATLAGVWGTDLVEQVLTDVGRQPES